MVTYKTNQRVHQARDCDKMPDNHTEWMAQLTGNWIWWLFFKRKIKHSLDLGQQEAITFGNFGFQFLPDTIRSCILVATQARTKITMAFSLPFHHFSVYSGGGRPRWKTGFVLRTLVMLLTKPDAQKMRKQTLPSQRPVWDLLTQPQKVPDKEKANYVESKKISGCQDWGERWEKEKFVEHREFLGQWNYSGWHYSGGNMSLCICPNPQNVPQSEL
jgi:hypothetical protein